MLDQLHSTQGSEAAARECVELMRQLYPLCRSITGDGVRRTLDLIDAITPLTRSEVPSGTRVFDWEVPREWNIRDAWVADASGQRLIDFRSHNLHVVGYSVPVRRSMTRVELEPHLHSLPAQPDWIPYRTSYYRETWGFCLRDRDRERLGDGPFEVVIDSELKAGHLSYAESEIAGRETGQALIYTHVCHPSLANDNLTGLAAAAILARELRSQTPRLSWRFVFAPGTIGSLTWLARNEARLPMIRGGLVIGLLGDAGRLTYKRSRRGNTATDRIVDLVLRTQPEASQTTDFEPYGYDERQFCSPGIDLPVGRLTRSPNDAYAQYHSSADDLSLISVEAMAGSIRTLARAIAVMDGNRRLRNLSPKGEPRLSKYGLFRTTGGVAPGQFENALLWVLSLSDGQHDLVAIATRSGLPFDVVDQAADALASAGLVETIGADVNSSEGNRV